MMLEPCLTTGQGLALELNITVELSQFFLVGSANIWVICGYHARTAVEPASVVR
ncbi:MAG: hypothetical protein RMI91_14085 [Gemmatales bacterium]|nr:hypothetical protein [Gemmatales bacterium]MDW7995775.1 hypothetical protein [Gemmatales bacterium]